ncbi:hypothetical protein [Clostridium tertium]
MLNIFGCYLDKYALILLILLICIFFIQKYNQKKTLKNLEANQNK